MQKELHPARYKMTDDDFKELITEFINYGGTGIEAISGRHSLEENEKYLNIAKEYKLFVSCGSDFHQPSSNKYREIGITICIPDDVQSVLSII